MPGCCIMLKELRGEEAEYLKLWKDQNAPALTTLTAMRPARPARMIRREIPREVPADVCGAVWRADTFWGELIIVSSLWSSSTDEDWESMDGFDLAMLCVWRFNEVSLVLTLCILAPDCSTRTNLYG